MLLTKVQKIKLTPSKINSSHNPFNLEFIKNFEEIVFDTPVTFILGENGSGKSTLLESIAVGINSIAIGSDNISRNPSLANAKKLAEYLKFTWNVKKSKSYFLRAEDVFGFVKKVSSMQSELHVMSEKYTGKDLGSFMARGSLLNQKGSLAKKYGENPDAFSHGETFLNLFESRFVPNSLYILDEPEAPLAFQRQLAFLYMLNDMVKQNCQFIITTHSPIIVSFSNAKIYSIENGKLQKTNYDSIENFTLYKDFLNNPKSFLEKLFK